VAVDGTGLLDGPCTSLIGGPISHGGMTTKKRGHRLCVPYYSV